MNTRRQPLRVAVVTGAAQGLGAAIAQRLLRDGYAVAFADLDQNAAVDMVAVADPTGTNSFAVETDVRRLDSVEGCLAATIDRWGHVDVWVNNAARTAMIPFFEIEPEEWDDVLQTNLRGTYFGCRVAGAHMRERRSGRIVNLESLAGQWGRSPTGAHYGPQLSPIRMNPSQGLEDRTKIEIAATRFDQRPAPWSRGDLRRAQSEATSR